MVVLSLSPLAAGTLALAIVSASVACGFLIARAAARRGRRELRERAYEFEARMDAFLGGSIRGRELLRAAADLEPDAFWEALGATLPALLPRARRDLERTLARSRHVATERRALRDDSPWRRELAARRLGAAGARRCLHELRRAMLRGPELVSLAAAMALGRARDGGALRWTLAHPPAFAHRSPRARIALLQSWGPRAAPRILACLAAGIDDPRMLRASIDALALADCVDAVPAIATQLVHEWRDVRVATARALGRLGGVGYSPALLRALADPEWQVRAQSARALGRLGAVDAVPVLAEALRDPAWWVRRHAAYALVALGPDARERLRAVAQSDPDRFAREIAAEALASRERTRHAA
jgi:HEAT repeat protein